MEPYDANFCHRVLGSHALTVAYLEGGLGRRQATYERLDRGTPISNKID